MLWELFFPEFNFWQIFPPQLLTFLRNFNLCSLPLKLSVNITDCHNLHFTSMSKSLSFMFHFQFNWIFVSLWKSLSTKKQKKKKIGKQKFNSIQSCKKKSNFPRFLPFSYSEPFLSSNPGQMAYTYYKEMNK